MLLVIKTTSPKYMENYIEKKKDINGTVMKREHCMVYSTAVKAS